MSFKDKYSFWNDPAVDGFVYRFSEYEIRRHAVGGPEHWEVWKEFEDPRLCAREWRRICDQVNSSALFASIAALWESRPERLADVTDQVRTIHDKLIEWGWKTVDRDQLDHATICYSRIVASYECCEWLPFDLVPAWEDDLYCLLMDEDDGRWQEYRNAGKCTSELAEIIRNETNIEIDEK
jgi:hypothetical protein